LKGILWSINSIVRLFDTGKREMLDTFSMVHYLKSLNPIEVFEAGEAFFVAQLNEGTEYLNLPAPAEGEQIFKPANK